MTPGKGIAVRFGVATKANAANKALDLPPVMSPSHHTPQASIKSGFYKPKASYTSQTPVAYESE